MKYLFENGLIGPLAGYLQAYSMVASFIGSKGNPLEKVFPALAGVLSDETPTERFRRKILEALPPRA